MRGNADFILKEHLCNVDIGRFDSIKLQQRWGRKGITSQGRGARLTTRGKRGQEGSRENRRGRHKKPSPIQRITSLHDFCSE
jgi:hypothetical protein